MSGKPTYKILIVEDNPEDRTTLSRYLHQDDRYNYQILEAALVSEALEICDRTLPDLILLDYLLPDDDGLVFLQEWHRRYGSSASFNFVPVVMLTGQGDEKIAVEAMKNGAQDYCVKGKLTAAGLRQTVHRVLQQLQLKRQIARQQEQQTLVNSIALRIRQSLRLEEVLQTTVAEVRQFLQTDRVLIYKFAPDMSGTMVAESVLPPYIACLNYQIEDTCFKNKYVEKYRQGRFFVGSDIYKVGIAECHIKLLESFQVKANLVVPILLNSRSTPELICPISESETNYDLWGLLIAHQCDRPREWQDYDLQLLQELAVQLAIAIQQAEMYERAQAELYARIEAEFRERQRVAAEFRALVENATDIIYRIDRDLRYLYFNPAIEKLVKQPASSLIGKNPQDLGISEEIIALWRATVDRIIVTKSQETIEHPFPDFNSPIWFEIRIVPELNETDEVHSFLCIARDISDRKKIKQKLQQLNLELETRVEKRTAQLQESQRFIESITDNTPNIIYIYDLQQERNIYCNREVLEILGYSPEQIQAMGTSFITDLTHPDDLENVLAHFGNLENLKDGQKRNNEYRLRDANGQWHWLLSRDAVFLRGKNGKVQQIVGTAQDITERKHIEEQLRKSETHLKVAQRIAGLGSWEFDVQTQDMAWSVEIFTIFGRNPEMGTPTFEELLQIVHPEDRDLHNQAVRQAIAQGQPYHIEFRLYRPDGKLLYLQARGEPIFNSEGQVVRLVGIVLDITHGKEAKEKLRNLSDRLSLAVKSGAIGIWDWDIGQNRLIWDDRMYELYGVQQSDFPEPYQTWAEGLHPDDREQAETAIQQALRGDREFTPEFRVIHPDGSIRYIKAYALVQRNQRGEPQRMVGINFDITSSKQAEEKLRRVNERLTLTNAELDRATRLKDEFLANMSHELRTPLNAILGMTEGLQDGVFGNLTDRQKPAVDSIDRSGNHLLTLINDVLDLAKVESGKLELQLAPTSITYLCGNSLTFVKQQAIKKNIQLITEIPSGLADIVVDELRIRQVLINLLSNAVKFTPDGGRVKLVVEPVRTPDKNLLHFSIIDTGIGMNPEDAAKLFKPFVQIDSRLNRQYSGTGLGLALVRRLIELHEGTVGVTSTLGQGSCFTISLPYVVSENTTVQPSVSQPKTIENEELQGSEQTTISTVYQTEASSSTILLVEDNEFNIATITSYLGSKGYKMLVAKNGEDGVRLAKSEHPDLILMDIQLPKVDGLEAIRQIRADKQLVHTPIIALTALAMPGDRDKCLVAGANEYMSKPVKLKQLVQNIQNLLRKR